MKIFSWNIYYNNKRNEEILEFIRRSDFDIFCLQEVSEKLLGLLKKERFNMTVSQDHKRMDDGGGYHMLSGYTDTS